VYILTTLKTLQTEFEFSFKNYTGKPYTTFLEKVSIHQETNKIGFVFFLIFQRFSMNFTRFSLYTLDLKSGFLQTGPWILRSSS
jgi:hypothetical protein